MEEVTIRSAKLIRFRCSYVNKNGNRCQKNSINGTCHKHNPNYMEHMKQYAKDKRAEKKIQQMNQVAVATV